MLKRLMQMRNLYEILAERQYLQNIEFMFPYLALVKLFSCLSQNLILIHVQVFRKHLEYLDIWNDMKLSVWNWVKIIDV